MSWQEGQALGPLGMPVITREQLSQYAEASGDHNRIHLDDQFAKEAGFPSVIAHGMLSMALIADYFSFCFPDANYVIGKMKTRFRKVTFPGDQLVCAGKIKKVNDDGSLIVSAWSENQRGEISCEAEASVRSR